MNKFKFFKNYFVWIVILVFFVLFSLHSLLNHWNFSTHAWDLGIYDQQTWLYGHFHSVFNTVRGLNLLSDHFGLILYPISLIYLIYPHAETMLLIQALLVVLSAYPLWAIAKHYIKSDLFSLTIVFLFLSSWGIQAAIDFDFHLATISVFFYAYFVYFMWRKKWYWAGIFALLSVISKEDMPIYLAFTSLTFLVLELFNHGKKEKIQSIFLIFSLLFFVLISWIMNRIHTVANFNYFSFSHFGKDYPEMLKNIFFHPINFLNKLYDQFITNPLKKSTFLLYLQGFSWLPLFAPQMYLALIPFLLIKFASDRDALWGLNGQYSVLGMFILSLATIYAVKNLQKIKYFSKLCISLLSIILIIVAIKVNIINVSFWQTVSLEKWQSAQQYQGLNSLIKQIPDDASVGTQDQIVPHLSSRDKIYLIKCIYCSLDSQIKYDYLLLDTRFNIIFNPSVGGDIQPIIKELLSQKTYENGGNYSLISKDEQENYSTYLFKNNQTKQNEIFSYYSDL